MHTPPMTVLDHELRVALELARRCGVIASRIQAGGESSLNTQDKAGGQGPVTAADLAVEAAILETLGAAFPDDAILAEESVGAHAWSGRERVWMIDPVDGTRDFADGSASWAIHIGLVLAGRPVLGVVCEPGGHRTSWGIDHADLCLAFTQRDGDPPIDLRAGAQARPPTAGPSWELVTSKSHHSPRLDPLAERLGVPAHARHRTGSTGVKAAMVARAAARIYAHPSVGTKLWDSCAPQALLHAAGGRITAMTGAPLDYGGPGFANDHGLLASAPGQDHAAIVEALRPLTADWFG